MKMRKAFVATLVILAIAALVIGVACGALPLVTWSTLLAIGAALMAMGAI